MALGAAVVRHGPVVTTTSTLRLAGRITSSAKGDTRSVTVDETAGMFSAVVGDVLTTKDGARIAATRYLDWLK